MTISITVSWEVWADGDKRYREFMKNSNGTQPNYVTIQGRKILLVDWINSVSRVNQFKKENNNKNPFTVKLTAQSSVDVTLITKDVLQSSTSIKDYVEKNGQLPSYVTITGKKYNMEQYIYISSKLIIGEAIGGKKAVTTDFKKHNISKPKIIPIKADIDKKTFYDMDKRVTDYMDKNGKAPAYISSKYGDVQFQANIYSNTKILDYYKKNNVMPNYVSLNLSKTSKLLNYMPKY